jgi:hypothetical protein
MLTMFSLSKYVLILSIGLAMPAVPLAEPIEVSVSVSPLEIPPERVFATDASIKVTISGQLPTGFDQGHVSGSYTILLDGVEVITGASFEKFTEVFDFSFGIDGGVRAETLNMHIPTDPERMFLVFEGSGSAEFSGLGPLPEPGAISLFMTGALAMAGYSWKRRRKVE